MREIHDKKSPANTSLDRLIFLSAGTRTHKARADTSGQGRLGAYAYALLTQPGGLTIVNITNPIQPVLAGSAPVQVNRWGGKSL